MDFIQRLALLFLLSIPAFLPNTAHADYPKTFTRFKLNIYNTYHASHTEACNYFVTVKANAYPSEGIHLTSCSETTVQAQGWSAGITYYSSGITKYGTCSGVESVWGNGICTGSCTAPYTMVNGSCTAPPSCTPPLVLDPGSNTCKDPCDPLKFKSVSYFTIGQSWPYSCYSGCQVEGSSGDCGYNAAGAQGCFYDGRYTGVSCTGSESGTGSAPPEPGDTPEYDCVKDGKSWGTVNGTTVCLAAGTPGSSPTTSQSAPSSSSNDTTNTDASGNSTTTGSDSTGSKVVTFNGDGTATTTESKTTTNSDGTQSTSQTEKTEPVADFCRDNPNVEQCKAADKGTFGGSCDAGFSCDGDAAQCAIAREIHTRNCELFKPDAEMTGKFNEAKNDNGSTNPAAAANITTVHLPTALDASSPYSGQCIQDVTIAVAGSSVTLPFSAWCPYLEAIGYLFLACAYISAAFILGSAV